MELIYVIIGIVLSFLGVKAFNTRTKQKTHDKVNNLQGQKEQINLREDIKSVPDLKPKDVVDYWDKELK